MVTVRPTTETESFCVLAQANQSISAERLMLFYIVLSLGSLLIALILSLIGYWPVFIFALVHQIAVGFLLWHAWRKQWIKEWVIVDPQHVQVIRIDHQGRQSWQMDSQWARLVWEPSHASQPRPNRLFLRAKKQTTEIGSFLSSDERNELARILSPEIARISLVSP